jgi:restriction endonuclease S subunit
VAFKQEIEHLTDQLQTQRDDLLLQVHLAGMDLKEEWEQSEYIWEQFKEKLAEIRDESKEITSELADKILVIGDELGNAYRRIVESLKN